MKKAINEANPNAATTGTNKMAGVPKSAPSTSERTVVGSNVRAAIVFVEDAVVVVVVASSNNESMEE